MSADLEHALDAVGHTIADTLLADADVRRDVVGRTVSMIVPEAGALGDSTTAWMCHQTWVECFGAIERGARLAADPEWVRVLADTPSGVRVAGGLAVLAKYDAATVAGLVSRPSDETAALIARFPVPPPSPQPAPHLAPPVPPAEPDPAPAAPAPPAATAVPPAPPPMADVQPAPTAFSPTTAPAPDDRRRRRRRRRTAMIVGAVITAIVLSVLGAMALADRADDPTPTAADTGLGPSSSTVAVDASPGCGVDPDARPNGAQTVAVPHRGLDRSYRLATPEVTPDDPDVPPGGLLVDLTDVDVEVDDHVATTGLDELAADEGWTVVSPSPLDGSAAQWNVTGDLEDPDDIGFVTAAADDAATRACVDLARVVIVGTGAGAHLAAEVVCTEPDRFAGLVMIAGAARPDSCESSSTSVSALLLTDDEVFPLDGGRGDGFPDLASLRPGSLYEPPDPRLAVSQWATAADCDTGVQDSDAELDPVEYRNCAGGVRVVAVTVAGGHGWAPAAPQLVADMMADAVLPATASGSG